MTNQIKIITDSTCDIPAAWQEQYDISVIPLTIVWGDEQFLDGVDMMPEAFYERLGTDKAHPTTSQPTPKSFMDAYQEAADAGYEAVLVITISAAMSGTHESAKRAAEDAPIPVSFVNSKSKSMGLGW